MALSALLTTRKSGCHFRLQICILKWRQKALASPLILVLGRRAEESNRSYVSLVDQGADCLGESAKEVQALPSHPKPVSYLTTVLKRQGAFRILEEDHKAMDYPSLSQLQGVRLPPGLLQLPSHFIPRKPSGQMSLSSS